MGTRLNRLNSLLSESLFSDTVLYRNILISLLEYRLQCHNQMYYHIGDFVIKVILVVHVKGLFHSFYSGVNFLFSLRN